MLAYNKE